MSDEIIISLISSILGGLFVTLLNHLFARRKEKAETQKIQAEEEKIRIETEKLRSEIAKLNADISEVKYHLPATQEKIIYDSKNGIIGYDFEITGRHSFKDGNLIIEQLGNFKVCLRKYVVDNNIEKALPKRLGNKTEKTKMFKERKFRVLCEARVNHGTFAFALLFQGVQGTPLIGQLMTVDDKKWSTFEWFLEAPNNAELLFSITHPEPLIEYLDLKQDLTNNTLYIKTLVLAEGI